MRRIVIMGVSGCGKSSVGEALAARLGIPWFDGDDLHPAGNVAKMRAGAGGPVSFVHLAGSRDLIAARMSARQGHYMPASLLGSQFAALEPPGPDEAVTADIAQPLEALVDDVLARLPGGRAGAAIRSSADAQSSCCAFRA